MVLTEEIDPRISPSHWRYAFMVEKATDTGLRRSLQVFDAAADAVHKVFLRDEAATSRWNAARLQIALPDQASALVVAARQPPEAANLM